MIEWTGASITEVHEIRTYADSGATDHFFVDRAVFSDYEELPNPIEGHAALKGAMFRVIGRGTVKKICHTAHGLSELVFKNALHAPDLASNLISITKFDKAGFSVIFGAGHVRFLDPRGREVLCGAGNEGMYLLNSLREVKKPTALIARSQMRPTTLEVWHRHFGHASVKTIKEVLARNLADGLVVKGDLQVPGLCEDCIYGKHASCPYDGEVTPEGSPNECVHINLWGPASTTSLGGATYMMLAVDGGSSHMSGYFLARKDAETTLTAFTSYHHESECQTRRKLCEARVDAGHEWVNEAWTAYLNGHGIILRITTPYAHAQNGLAERANQTILEGLGAC